MRQSQRWRFSHNFFPQTQQEQGVVEDEGPRISSEPPPGENETLSSPAHAALSIETESMSPKAPSPPPSPKSKRTYSDMRKAQESSPREQPEEADRLTGDLADIVEQ